MINLPGLNHLLLLLIRFDTCGAGELSTKVADTCGKVQDGLGRRVADVLENLFQFMVAFSASLYLCWQLTVVLLASFPLIAVAGKFDHKRSIVFTPFYLCLFAILQAVM